MAFKFKTKKRPSLGQAVAGGFAQGVSAGIQQAAQLSLQDRLKRQEDEKTRLKTQLDLFNSMIGNIEQSSANRKVILKGKDMIIRTDGKINASQAFSTVSPDFAFMPTKAEKEEKQNMSKDPSVFDAESLAMRSIGMGGLKPSESVVTRREDLADIEAGVKADPRSTINIVDQETGVKRLVTKDEALGPEMITEAAPFEKDAFDISRNVKTGALQFSTDATKNVFQFEVAPDGHKRYIEGPNKNKKVFPGIKLPNKFQLKTLKNGDEALFNPATGEITVKVANKQRTPDQNTNLKNLLKERARLLAKKKGNPSFTFGFDIDKTLSFDTPVGEFTDTDTESLRRVENELATNFDYGWLISEYDMIDADRPPSFSKEAWDRSTEAEKKELVNSYQESLLLDKQEPRTLINDSGTRYPLSNDTLSPSIVDVGTNDQMPPSAVDVGFTAQPPTSGMKFRLPPELVKKFGSGSITVESMQGNKVILKTDKGIKKVMPLSKWYTFRFAPTS